MELKLEHIVGYLPFGLKMQYIENGKIISTGILRRISHNDFETHPTRLSINYQNEEHIWMFKPLLLPLSSLTKEQLIKVGSIICDLDNGNMNQLLIEVGKDFINGKIDKIDLVRTIKLTEYLYSIHADLHNLIPNNLAIDKSELVKFERKSTSVNLTNKSFKGDY